MLIPGKLARRWPVILTSCLAGFAFTIETWGAKTLTINLSSDWMEFLDASGTALSQGDADKNQDGAALQLGYFTEATADNLFAGEWKHLTWAMTIGDTADLTGYGDGTFSFTVYFQEGTRYVQVYGAERDSGAYKTEVALAITTSQPSKGTYLAIRFFNHNLGNATHYNTIASPSWQWTELSDLGFGVLELSVDEAEAVENVQFEDSINTFTTSIAISSWDYGKTQEGSWSYLPWLGYYYQDSSTPWVFHVDHGWLYRVGNKPGDVWFYDKSGLGWIWTNVDAYPYFYSKDDAGWLWFKQGSSEREFYHFGTSEWKTHSFPSG